MSIDLSKLTPLPLLIDHGATPMIVKPSGFPVLLSEDDNVADLEFWLLARNAFDAIARRKIDQVSLVATIFADPSKSHQTRYAFVRFLQSLGDVDLFTMVIEADRWLIQQEKNVAL